MNPAVQSMVLKVTAIAAAIMLVTTLSAIALVRADNREGELVLDRGDANGSYTSGSGAQSGTSAGSRGGATGPGNTGASGGPTPTGVETGGGGQGQAQGPARGGGGGGPAGGEAAGPGGAPAAQCADYNPDQGVYCDKFLIGGTTVLSGPLAVYGEQGLRAGQAWVEHYNNVVSVQEGSRKLQLIWYDDNLDPNKTLQFTQRLYEVDKVLYLAGVTSPESISAYLMEKKFPMIGDIGLSPKSYKNPMIFPTAPADDFRPLIRLQMVTKDLGVKSVAVIQDILPGVDSTPIKKSWVDGAKRFNVDLKLYTEIESTSSDCGGQMLAAIQQQPDFIFMPAAAPPMLACLRTAATQGVRPDAATSPWLKGWSGGTGLEIEADQCLPACDGMYSVGTLFNDPRTSNTPQMKTYRENMATYAPGIDITGIIALNYYHIGWVNFNLIKDLEKSFTINRDNLVAAANKFGPFETGFGNSVTWRPELPRTPTTCAYRQFVSADARGPDGRAGTWVFDDKLECV